MLIRAITTNAEESLLSALEAKKKSAGIRSFLQCAFSSVPFSPPEPENLIVLLKDIVKDYNPVLYLCNDKDIFIERTGAGKGVITALQGEIAKYCLQKQEGWDSHQFFHYYDVNANGEELRITCKHKITKQQPEKPIPAANTNKKITNFTPDQYQTFESALRSRKTRARPEVLIVEDQAFSRKLLTNILSHEYKCHIAKNAAEALDIHSRFAPDVILLDIELPDTNGHEIAKFIRTLDPKVWVIMVTANNYQNDVILAKENKVQGFIAKPYNRQRILEIMDNFEKNKK